MPTRFSRLNSFESPLLRAWDGPLGTPLFDLIRPEDFLPALKTTTTENTQEIALITANAETPDFENTILAMEKAGAALARVRRLFWLLASAQAIEPIRAIEAEMSKLLSAHGTAIGHDEALFSRVASIIQGPEYANLTSEQKRLTEKIYKGFVRGGAALAPHLKERFGEIDARLAELSVRFGHNVIAATNEWTMVLDARDLDGIPQSLRDAAAARAQAADDAGHFHITLDRTDYESFLAFSDRRDLRERLWRAFTSRCDVGKWNNWPIIAESLTLRDEQARLLGYEDFASYQLDDSMVGFTV